jgi:hypothetical protein
MSRSDLRNLTIRVETRVLYLAALRAHFDATSLNAVIEAFLAEYANVEIEPRPRRTLRPPTYRDLRDEFRRRERGGRR